MALIPTVTWSEFKAMKPDDLKETKSFEVSYNGEYLFTVIIPSARGGTSINDDIRTTAEYLGSRSNSSGGREPTLASLRV